MALRLVEIILPDSEDEQLKKLLKHEAVVGFWRDHSGGYGSLVKVLLPAGKTEAFLDELEKACGHTKGFRMVILPVEATVPRLEEPEKKVQKPQEKKKGLLRISREELFADITDNMKLSKVYITMVILSTVVAAIGLARDNATIVIGAMVMAPLLGPNVAQAFSTTLGDIDMGRRALKTNISGLTVALLLSLAFGYFVHFNPGSAQLLARTEVSLSDIVLALASGIAGVLAFTSGIPTALIGVMVAVALMPPLVTFGLYTGNGEYFLAVKALLLVLTNVVCLNLAGVVTFLAVGVRPRTYFETEKARKATRQAIALWTFLLLFLALIIYYSRESIG